MITLDFLYILMLIFIYGALVLMLFRLRRVLANHDHEMAELNQTVAVFDVENARMADYEEQRRVEIDAIEKEIAELNAKIAEIEESISEAKQQARMRIYLGSERRTASDTEFLIKVTNDRMTAATRPTAYARSWANGRYYVIWATSLDTAQSIAFARFPQIANFTVEQVERSQFRVGDRHS